MNLKENQFTYFEEVDRDKIILAKEDRSIQEHSMEVMQVANTILKNTFIQDENKWWGKIRNSLEELILYCSYIHDAGKGDKRWQEYFNKKLEGKGNGRPPISHPLFSLPIAKEYLERNIDIEREGMKSFLVSLGLQAIVNHHSNLRNDKYEREKYKDPQYLWEFSSDESPYEIFKKSMNDVVYYPRPKEVRYLYILLNGILTISDWMASSNSKYYKFDSSHLNSQLNQYFMDKIRAEPYDYQVHAKSVKGNILIQLPTGCGKTETALFWLASQNVNKFFYTLPTVTTVEAMRKRFEEILGRGRVSFAHHLLEMSLKNEDRLTEEELFFQKHLLRPTAVTTIDRVLLSLLNFGRFTASEILLNNSAIVIDEIHSYSPFTFSLIFEGLRYLKEYHNVRLCVMSATLPDVIRDFISSKEYDHTKSKFKQLIEDKKIKEIYRGKRRTTIKVFYEGEPLENNIEAIIKATKKFRKVLVVVNTVTKAQIIFKRIKKLIPKDTIPVLFHSRFIHRDRWKIQQKVEKLEKSNERIIIIATQIVEVSLDIDFDVLLTEIAPIDSLIQRAGRVNRKGKKKLSDIYVYDVIDEKKGYLPYDKKQIIEARDILSNVVIKSEADYLKYNNRFYEELRSYYEHEIKNGDKLRDFLSQLYGRKGIDKAMKTRDGFLTVPAVPVCFENEINRIDKKIEASKAKNEILELGAEKLGYFVPIAFYNSNFLTPKNYGEGPSVQFVRFKYNSDFGLLREEEPDKTIIV